MDLTPLLRQTVAWSPKTGTDARSDATYGPVQNIAARVTGKYRDIIMATGETVTTTQQVLTVGPVAIGDHLNGRQVIQVDALTDYAGSTTGYCSVTR